MRCDFERLVEAEAQCALQRAADQCASKEDGGWGGEREPPPEIAKVREMEKRNCASFIVHNIFLLYL